MEGFIPRYIYRWLLHEAFVFRFDLSALPLSIFIHVHSYLPPYPHFFLLPTPGLIVIHPHFLALENEASDSLIFSGSASTDRILSSTIYALSPDPWLLMLHLHYINIYCRVLKMAGMGWQGWIQTWAGPLRCIFMSAYWPFFSYIHSFVVSFSKHLSKTSSCQPVNESWSFCLWVTHLL